MSEIVNASTLKSYSGKNLEILSNFMAQNRFTTNRFATMRQWNMLGRCIKTGSRSCGITWVDSNLNNENDRRRGYALKSYRVFNFEQTREYTEEERSRFNHEEIIIPLVDS